MAAKKSFLYNNSLSIVLLVMMFIFWGAQFVTGWKDHNQVRKEHQHAPLSAAEYFTSGHFVSATFENWESEFLQMSIYVLLTIGLRQKGSAESKKPDGEEGADEEDVDREPKPGKNAPWPVNKGGIWLKLYENSLSIALASLFVLSFWLHFMGSYEDYNGDQELQHLPLTTPREYLGNAHFWFESFQNWQSEFLAVAAIVLLSVWLRQKGSPESKPVDAPHSETGK